MNQTEDKSQIIRDAATVIVLREGPEGPRILMGQRGAKAAFMPSKFVFPGGAVDEGDAAISFGTPLNTTCHARLQEDCESDLSNALAAAAIRELWEETGLRMAIRGEWRPEVPDGWHSFAEGAHLPNAAPMEFVFRAITPPGRPRRFDARFFLADAADLMGDLDDFTHASDELSHLQWVPLAEARKLDLPFITEVVLAEIAQRAQGAKGERGGSAPASVPFFKNDDEANLVLRLKGASLLD